MNKQYVFARLRHGGRGEFEPAEIKGQKGRERVTFIGSSHEFPLREVEIHPNELMIPRPSSMPPPPRPVPMTPGLRASVAHAERKQERAEMAFERKWGTVLDGLRELIADDRVAVYLGLRGRTCISADITHLILNGATIQLEVEADWLANNWGQ